MLEYIGNIFLFGVLIWALGSIGSKLYEEIVENKNVAVAIITSVVFVVIVFVTLRIFRII